MMLLFICELFRTRDPVFMPRRLLIEGKNKLQARAPEMRLGQKKAPAQDMAVRGRFLGCRGSKPPLSRVIPALAARSLAKRRREFGGHLGGRIAHARTTRV
jgi:hypothetical protein